MSALPVNLICGYLGAGKTTLLNRLLETADQRIAVMVNDFGAINVDAALISKRSAGTIQLSNGCICCTMGQDLFAAFDRVFAMRDQIDRLVIEASGVAEPWRISAIATAEPDLAPEQVIALVCAASFQRRLADPRISDVLSAQIAGADKVVVSRTDITDPAQVAQVCDLISVLNPRAQVLRGNPPPNAAALLAGASVAATAAPGRQSNHRQIFGTVPVLQEAPPTRRQFDDAMSRLPDRVHRAKGFVRLADAPGLWVFQYEDRRLKIEPSSATAPAHALAAIFIGPDLTAAHLPAFTAQPQPSHRA